MTKLIQPIEDDFENHARAVSLGVLTADMFDGKESQIAIQVRADEITVEREKSEAKSLKAFIKRNESFKKAAGKKTLKK